MTIYEPTYCASRGKCPVCVDKAVKALMSFAASDGDHHPDQGDRP